MSNLIAVWQELPLSKKLILVAAIAGTIFGVSMIGRMATQPEMSLLYAGLDNNSAGEVVAGLETANVPFEVRGDAIYVPFAQRDRVRLQLAREGIPRQGAAGYELLDNLNGFSTTSELFDATYWRAKEGELARTILASSNIQSVRVHIAATQQGAFSRNTQPPTASVTITSRTQIAPQQALSFRYLVALAVPRLEPDAIAIIDSDRGILLAPGNDNPFFAALNGKDEREQKLAMDLANLLQARVGNNNVRVKVTLDLDHEREAMRERVIDPDSRIIIGRETNETNEQSSGTRNGAVTVASNLPEGDASANTNQSSTSQTQTRENLRYDVSELNREREKLPGQITRMSIAVLINELVDENNNGRSDEELAALRALIISASGFNEDRGDNLTIQAMTFIQTPEQGTIAEASFAATFLERHLISIIKLSLLVITILVLALFVIKPLLNKQSEPLALTADAEELQQLTSTDIESSTDTTQELPPGERLKMIASEKTEETANLLKTWLEQPEDAT